MSVVEREQVAGGPPRAHESPEGLDRHDRTLHEGRPLRHGGVFFNRGSVTFLQRTAGNAAVTQMLRGSGAVAGPGSKGGPKGAAVVGARADGQAAGAGGSAVVALSGPVTGSVIQRKVMQGGGYQPPAPPKPPDPYGDPKFVKVQQGVKKAKKELKAHPPAKAEAKKAQLAAKAPAADKEAQAKAAKADTMAGAKKSGFDKAAFIAALTAALSKNKPQNLEQADEFSKSGKADGLKNEVVGKVSDGKKAASQDMEAKAKEPPDPSVAKEKEVKPLEPEKQVKPPAPDFAKGMPSKAPPEQLNLQGGKNETEAKMKEAEVSEADLKKSNEPQMVAAAEAKEKGDEHSAKAPAEVRQKEAETLKSAQAGASEKGKSQLAAMVAKKGSSTGQVKSKKDETKAKDEARRAEVTANVTKIFDKTKADTEKILTELDGKVTAEFDKGEAEAKKLFTQSHETAMRKYKADRYGGWLGGAKWLKDKVMGMPSEVNAFYETAKGIYVEKMTALAHRLADLIDKELTRAKDRIQQGRDELKKYVTSLPKDLQKVGAEAAKAMEDKFSSLESDVENKGQSLQEDLASKYTEAMEAVNAEIEKMQAENKGLWDSIKDAVAGAIKTILALKDLFMSILAKAAVAFKKIVKDPLRFIGNFLNAVKQGFMNFANNILEHLKKGLKSWLFGALAAGGIEIPESFDLKGIIKLVLSILGLTWGNIRPRIVKVIGEKAMKVLETSAEVFIILVKEGPAGLIKWLMDKLSDLKDMVMGQIKSFVIEKIVKAGISWVSGMLNPAGALIKIIQALIAVVQWIMEKGEALAGLINSIIDAVIDIADGGGGGVPAKIEQALSDAIPLVLSFLAGLLGLGGISEKIKSILEAVQKPVMKAVDKVIMAAVKLAGPIIRAVKGLGAKVKKKVLGLDDSPEGKQKRLDSAMDAAVAATRRFAGKPIGDAVLKPVLGAIKIRYGLTSLEPVLDGDEWAARGTINPTTQKKLGVPALKESKYVIPGTNQLKPTYAAEIREWFYKKGFRSARKATVINAAADKSRPGWYWCVGYKTDPPHRIRASQVTLDHSRAVAQHWNGEGRKTTQDERYEWYDEPSNLVVMCGPHNSAKGSRDIKGNHVPYVDTVTKTFRGWQET